MGEKRGIGAKREGGEKHKVPIIFGSDCEVELDRKSTAGAILGILNL